MKLLRHTAFGIALISIVSCGGGGGGGSDVTGTGGNGGNGGGGGNNCVAGDGTICVLGTTFNPVDITISKNTAVTFQEVAGAHFIVFDNPVATGVANVGDFSSGTASRTFTETGTFPYHCTIHGGVGTGMHGTIKVQ